MKFSIVFGFILRFILIAVCLDGSDAKDVKAHVGSSVELPCNVDASQCGELHSVKWYRDTRRIYVYSQLGTISKPVGNATTRMSVAYSPNSTEALLRISQVELTDEASYKCEITYLEVRDNCDVVQIIKLQTLVEPRPARIFSTKSTDETSIANSTFGPFDENTDVELVCESAGGRPEPTVRWYNGSHEMTANYASETSNDGLTTAKATINPVLTRGDLRARYECRVTGDALKTPMTSWITMDVHIKPIEINLEFQKQVVQGNEVRLICDVFGANPAATVTWFNSTSPITNETLIQTVPEAMPIYTRSFETHDGTYTTKSELVFKATQWDNGRHFKCYAENTVTLAQKDPSFKREVMIEVMYAPVVSVEPENITRTEGGQNVHIKCRYLANPPDLLSVYWLKEGKNLTLIPGKHEAINEKNIDLRISNVSRSDMGQYSCVLMNQVGASESENSAYLNVQYAPSVEVLMDPSRPIKSRDEVNVTAVCGVTAGNPSSLTKVRWYLGDDLLKELPECNYTFEDSSNGGPYCNVDPSILSLVTVDETFAGNYTCQGMNSVGWGTVSEPTELIVYYPPSPARLVYSPSKVIKRGQVELSCDVDDPGRPDNLTFVWYRGVHRLLEETSSKMIINPVKLDTRNNFTCTAVNDGGSSESSTTFVNVSAPPTFITSLTYQHVKSLQPNMSLTCRVECSPLCYISWFKGREQIDTRNNPLYDIKTSVQDANTITGDFESIESTLIWNVNAWPVHPFAKTTPTATYTCVSSSNGIGNGVNASVQLEVQYSPENVTASQKIISVVEHKIPDRVNCTAKGIPDPKFKWLRKSNGRELVDEKSAATLTLPPVTRNDTGKYICVATNVHGSESTEIFLDVLYPPDCLVTKTEHRGDDALLCTVDANPMNVSFAWSFRSANGSWENYTEETRLDGNQSYLILESGIDTVRTYRCVANNSAGVGTYCQREVPGVAAPWWHIFGDNIYILVAIIAGIILCAIFVCIIIIIIICVCKRRRARSKYNNPVELEEREKPDGHSAESSKWHLRPLSMSTVRIFPQAAAGQFRQLRSSTIRASKGKKKIRARLERLRDLLGLGSEQNGGIPRGIYSSPGGVVTFKKLRSSLRLRSSMGGRNASSTNGEGRTTSRKRKKPGGCLPNQSSAPDRGGRLGGGGPNGDGMMDPLTANPEKGVYENLPFHGMQTPPNKPVSIIAPFSLQGQRPLTAPATTLNCSTKSLFPLPPPAFSPPPPYAQRIRSFHSLQNVQRIEKFNFDLSPTVVRNEKDKNFRTLELKKKHKCYSPTFYSMRCKKHSKKIPQVYALPKKSLSEPKLKNQVFVFGNGSFQNLTDSIQIKEETPDKAGMSPKAPKPAPRCKKHRRPLSEGDHVYENLALLKSTESLDTVTKALVHADSKVDPLQTVMVLPSFVKPKFESPKGALNLQLQAKIKTPPPPGERNAQKPKDTPLISEPSLSLRQKASPQPQPFNVPEMPLLRTLGRWSASTAPTGSVKLQQQPFRPEFSDLVYADVDYKSYGPINYKAASIDNALAKKKTASGPAQNGKTTSLAPPARPSPPTNYTKKNDNVYDDLL